MGQERKSLSALKCFHILQKVAQPAEEWWVSEAAFTVPCNHSLSCSLVSEGPARETHLHSHCEQLTIHEIPAQLCLLTHYWSTRPSSRHTSMLHLRTTDGKHWRPSLPSPWRLKTDTELQLPQWPRTSACLPWRFSGLRPVERWHRASPKSAHISAHLSSLALHWRSSSNQDKTKILAIHLDLSSEMTFSVWLTSGNQGQSILIGVRDNATRLRSICQINLDVQSLD